MPKKIFSMYDRLLSYFITSAVNGNFCCFSYLTNEEKRLLIDHGCTITDKRNNNRKNSPYLVSWQYAFHGDIPSGAKNYIEGKTDVKPEGLSLAQKLYIVAARTRKEESKY